MASNVTQLTTAGLAQLWYAGRNSSGYCTGGTGTLPDAAVTQTMSGMARLYNVQEVPFVPEAPEIVQIAGDDGVAAQFQFNATALPNGVIKTGTSNDDFAALAMGLVSHDLGDSSFLLLNNTTVTYADLILMTISQAKDRSTGAAGYFGYIILNANVFYLGADALSGRTENAFNWQVTGNKASKFPWGVAFTDVADGDTEAVILQYSHPYPPMIDVIEGDGVVTTFTLSALVAADSAANVRAWVNGTEITWVTGAPGAGEFGITESTTDTIVFGTAPADSSVVVVWYGRE